MNKTRHFAALDGLRGVAALAVMTLHVLDPVSAGYLPIHAPLAVDFFFGLSGFVVAHAYEQRLRDGLPFFDFARIRLTRLYPLILVGLVFGFVVSGLKAWSAGDSSFIVNGSAALAAGLIMLPSPFLLAPGNLGAFPFNIPTWSLLVELVVNAAHALSVRFLSNRVLAVVILAGAALLIGMSIIPGGLDGAENWSTFYRAFGKVLFSYSVGVALARLHHAGVTRRWRAPPALLAAMLAAFLFVPTVPMPDLYNLLIVLFVFPAIVAAGANAELSGGWLKFALFAGQLSYPLYILHYPFVKIFSAAARSLDLQGLPLMAFLALEIVTILVASAFAMKFIDEPIRKRLNRSYVRVRSGA